MDGLKPVNTGVPQGPCTSPILVAYFTAPMCEAILRGTKERIEKDPELSTLMCTGKASHAPLTLYVDDGSIAASAHNCNTSTKIIELAFQAAHKWLTARGLKVDQVKNELIHFTRSNHGRHAGEGPPVSIPTNTPRELKMVQLAKTIKYLGVWLDSHLNFTTHIQKMTSKAITAMHALRLLGNSIRGMHQMHAQLLYIGAILPVATYGLAAFFGN